MRAIFAAIAAVLFPFAVNAQTQIGSWKFQEEALAPEPGVYFIQSSIGDPKGPTFSSVDFHCGKGAYTFNFFAPQENPRTGHTEVPDGRWKIDIVVNNLFPVVLTGTSRDSFIAAPVSREVLVKLKAARSISPMPDFITVLVEKIDGGGRYMQAYNYPASRLREALAALDGACK